jgi:hypothetical protein
MIDWRACFLKRLEHNVSAKHAKGADVTSPQPASADLHTKIGREESPCLEDLLHNRAIELWSTTAGRLFLVADDADASRAMEQLGARRGEIYTAAEVKRIIVVNDPAVVAEIHDWKRQFDGNVREFRGGARTV